MRVGTKSLLIGVHQIFLHPWFVAWAWWRLFGFPFHPLLWVAFFVHDLGYWGKPNMDGEEGETHVELGANIVAWLANWHSGGAALKWMDFCLYHSRFYAYRDDQPVSKLCIADKQAFLLTPRWLYMWQAKASGEVYEYMRNHHSPNIDQWYDNLRQFMEAWVKTHKSGKQDTWTTGDRSDDKLSRIENTVQEEVRARGRKPSPESYL